MQPGSSLTHAAEDVFETMGKLMNDSDYNESQKLEFIYITSHIRTRNVKLQCFLFTINWNILLAVSEKSLVIVQKSNLIFPDDLDHRNLLSDNLSTCRIITNGLPLSVALSLRYSDIDEKASMCRVATSRGK